MEKDLKGFQPYLFWRELGYRHRFSEVPPFVKFRKFHLTTKTGPNGRALLSSLWDLWLIAKDPQLVKDLCTLGGRTIEKIILGFLSRLDFFETLADIPELLRGLRKVTWFRDREAKVRVVAILDYWSQTVLHPLHCWLYKKLRQIPQDCTFDQGNFTKGDFLSWGEYYSIDLTNATDRFPIKLISLLLNGLLPSDYVAA